MYSIHEQINIAYGYLHGLWRYRWSALFLSWLAAIAGGLYVYSLPDVYQSNAAISIDNSSVMQPLLRGLMVEADTEEEINVMTRVLLSRENLLSVLRETDMDIGVETPEAREAMAARLAQDIEIDGIGGQYTKSKVYEIRYKSNSAEQSFKVVFNLLNTLIENTLNSGRLDTEKAEAFLNEQIRDYEQRLIEAEERLANFKKKNVGFMPDERGGYYARVRGQQGTLDAIRSDLRLAKQRLHSISQQLSGEKPMLGGGLSAGAAAKLSTLEDELENLLIQYTDEHPDVISVRTRIDNLKRDARAAIASQAAGDSTGRTEMNPVYRDLKAEESKARIEVGTLQIKLAEERQKKAELEKSIDIIPQVEADLSKLNRDYDITRDRYLQLVERRESARLAQKVEENNSELIFRVVDAPVVPLLPVGPNRELYLAAIFLGAIALGLMVAVFRFLLYPTFVDFKQMQKMIDLPVLGSVRMQVSPEIRRQRKMTLTSYMLVFLVMCGMFAAAVMYSQQGSVQVRMLMAALGQ